ncbi:MAG: rRNA maturation RNase YbeY [Candidatus Omnitrophica bacterium]|nr:rRNA maturation RNase YbeY [Candidatus Omnitrophota bacterium]MCK5393400.1 rRNA maturation RNase YbeY [Candidatus Omnitrophota bacterium]
MKVEIINNQNLKRINLKSLHEKFDKLGFSLDIADKQISFYLCDNEFIKNLNKKYFKKNSPTDVISFPLKDDLEPDYLGEVVVSVETAIMVSKDLNIKWQKELFLYLIHGVLHLIGYDDMTKIKRSIMEKKQEALLEEIY